MDKGSGKAILIVGDWVVDEYWFLVKHYSILSSHTGYTHYRISSANNEPMKDLCGAGHVARVLFDVIADDDQRFSIYGLGNWHPADTEMISHLLHKNKENCNAAKASYRIMPDYCNRPANITLIPIYEDGTTIRVIRQYNQQDKGLEQLNRVDWEMPPVKGKTLNKGAIREKLPNANEVVAIIVQDLDKGVVTDELVEMLCTDFPKAHWYVRTKHKNRDWISTIKKKLDLLIYGPEILLNEDPWDRWIENGKITKQAADLISPILGCNIVLLSDRRELIFKLKNSDTIFTGKSTVLPTHLTQLGWPTAVFANLVYIMLWKDGIKGQQEIIDTLTAADHNCGVPLPSAVQVLSPSISIPPVRKLDWKQITNEWHQASSDLGIITTLAGELKLEMWRGSTYISNYITCIDGKKTVINNIGSHIRAFLQDPNPIKSLSIFIQADPGSGKTFLAKSLARTFDINFLRFDVTQMIHRENLLDLFDSISTAQVSTNRRLLVFVDEVNAELDGSPVFGAFLSPLEEGFYVRNGNTHILLPCIWIFAGTHLDTNYQSHKFSDFTSRMTLTVSMDYATLRKDKKPQLQNQAQLEQVYLGAAMVKSCYPDIQWISKEVLNYFHCMDPESVPAREIRNFAALLKNVQYGVVTKKNCEMWPKDFWEEIEGGETLVQLVF